MRYRRRSVSSFIGVFLLGVLLLGALVPVASDAATLNANPSNLQSVISSAQPGDIIQLANGTYPSTVLTCGSNANNGTSGAPIKLRAANERQAYFSSNGIESALRMVNCSWWVVEGLRGSSQNNINGNWDIVDVVNGTNLTFRRLLLHRTNQASDNGTLTGRKNTHAMWIYNSSNILVEESELYDFHRHGFSVYYSQSVTLRRNYMNPRSADDGDEGSSKSLAFYPASNNIAENNIIVGGFVVLAASWIDNNKLYGNIMLDTTYDGGQVWDRESISHNTYLENNLFINNGAEGLEMDAAENTVIKNATMLGNTSHGLLMVRSSTSSRTPSATVQNSLAVNNAGTGFMASGAFSWSMDYVNAYGNSGGNFSPSSSPYLTHATTTNPQLGSCKVFIPDSSPMKGAGKDGADIGANILYRYENGILTNQPLWDPVTGKFPSGAIVVGVNDIAGSSSFDVHKRLNVNVNGCSLPSGYGKPPLALSRPANLRIVGNR